MLDAWIVAQGQDGSNDAFVEEAAVNRLNRFLGGDPTVHFFALEGRHGARRTSITRYIPERVTDDLA